MFPNIVAYSTAATTSTIVGGTGNPDTLQPVCEIDSTIGSGWFETPVVLLNSPYNDSASGDSSQTVTAAFSITSGPISMGGSVSTSSGWSLSIANGQAVGIFEYDQWTMYAVSNHYQLQPADPCTQSDVAKITSYGTSYCTAYLLSSGTWNDLNEPTQIPSSACQGNPSISFQNGYSTATGDVYTCNGPAATYSSSTTYLADVSISLTIDSYSATGTMSVTGSSTKTYNYNFAAGSWTYYQTLDSGYNNAAWSFATDYGGCTSGNGGGCGPQGGPIALQIAQEQAAAGINVSQSPDCIGCHTC